MNSNGQRLARSVVALAFIGCALTGTPGIADDTEFERESLRGLGGIRVAEVVVDENLSDFALDSDLATEIELRLRVAGVRLYTESELDSVSRRPMLWVDVIAIPIQSGFAIGVRMELTQNLWVSNEGELMKVVGTTWSSQRLHAFGTNPLRQGALRASVMRMTHQFINAWLSSHSMNTAGKPVEP